MKRGVRQQTTPLKGVNDDSQEEEYSSGKLSKKRMARKFVPTITNDKLIFFPTILTFFMVLLSFCSTIFQLISQDIDSSQLAIGALGRNIDSLRRENVHLMEITQKEAEVKKQRGKSLSPVTFENPVVIGSNGNVVHATNGGRSFSIEVYEEEDNISNAIKNGGGWENDLLQQFNNFFATYSAEHDIPLSELTFIDVGANLGWFSFALAALEVNVIAFEPLPENIEKIKKSLALPENVENGVSKRIKLYPIGLGAEEKTCIIFSDDRNIGDGHVKCLEDESEFVVQEGYSVRGNIPVQKLDDILETVEDMNVVLVKMNCEGFEAHTVAGGKNVLSEVKTAIVTNFRQHMIREKGGEPTEMMRTLYSDGFLVKRDIYGYMSLTEMVDMDNFPEGSEFVVLHSKHIHGKKLLGFGPQTNSPDAIMSLEELVRVKESQRPPSANFWSSRVPEKVPHKMWFTYKHDILKTRSPERLYLNLLKTIETYRRAWGDPDAPAKCLSDDDCIPMIEQADPRLAPIFEQEVRGMFKADICRIAALYLHGGYYFDSDIEVIDPVMLDRDGLEFASVYNAERAYFFQAFIAVPAKSPIMKGAMDAMVDAYNGELQYRYEKHLNDVVYLMGCITLYYAYEDYKMKENEKHLILAESNPFDEPGTLSHNVIRKLVNHDAGSRLGMGKDCNYVVEDRFNEQGVYFWSHNIGEGICAE